MKKLTITLFMVFAALMLTLSACSCSSCSCSSCNNEPHNDVYTVTYYYNYTGAPDEGVYKTADIDVNTAATEPTAPTRTGYTFSGWHTDENCTAKYDFSTLITEDLSLYAKWTQSSPTPEKRTVTYYNNFTGGV